MYTLEEHTTLVGISELRSKWKDVLKALKHSRVMLALRNAPFAVLVPLEKYRQMEAALEQLSDERLGHEAKKRAAQRDVTYVPLDTVRKKLGRA